MTVPSGKLICPPTGFVILHFEVQWVYTVYRSLSRIMFPVPTIACSGSIHRFHRYSCFMWRVCFTKLIKANFYTVTTGYSQPRWLSWMRRPTGDQEVAGSTPVDVGNILSWRLIMKYFLRSFSPFRWFKKGSCQFLAKECAQYWLTA